MATLTLDLQLTNKPFSLAVTQTMTLQTVVGVLGPSGSGKTSLLRCIAGLEVGATGSLLFNDQVWLDSARRLQVPVHARGVGYVFQDARLFPHLSVSGNLEFAKQYAQPQGPDIHTDQVIATLELESLLGRKPDTLSGGERQRVAIARALLARPNLLLMDEPLSATDYERRSSLLPFFRSVMEQFKLPTVYVSHSLDELAALTDSLLVLRHGRVVAFGETDAVMGRLDLGEVSGALEAGAIIEARVVSHDPLLYLSSLEFAGQTLTVPQFTAAPGNRVRLRIHARDVALATEPPRGLSIRNVLKGRVLDIAEQENGPSADVLVAVGDDALRARITRASLTELGLQPGHGVFALIKTASVEADRSVS